MLNHKGTCQLKTKRLVLRKILPEDAKMVYEWMSDFEICRYERWKVHPNVEFSRGYIIEVFDDYKSNYTYQWGIELNKELIGSISIINIDDFDQKAVMGYCIKRNFWGNGYATEAAKAVLEYMFNEVGLNRIEASHSVNNKASGRVLEKVGMILEGCAKEYYYSNIGFQDSNLYALTRGEYIKVKKEY